MKMPVYIFNCNSRYRRPLLRRPHHVLPLDLSCQPGPPNSVLPPLHCHGRHLTAGVEQHQGTSPSLLFLLSGGLRYSRRLYTQKSQEWCGPNVSRQQCRGRSHRSQREMDKHYHSSASLRTTGSIVMLLVTISVTGSSPPLIVIAHSWPSTTRSVGTLHFHRQSFIPPSHHYRHGIFMHQTASSFFWRCYWEKRDPLKWSCH